MHSFYTPLFLCGWFNGIWGQLFLKGMTCMLNSQWDRSYAEVLWWICAWLAFAIVQASVLCMCDSCIKWRSLSLEDGAAIDHPFDLLLLLQSIFVLACFYVVCVCHCNLLLCVTRNIYIIIIRTTYLPIWISWFHQDVKQLQVIYNWWPNEMNVGAL